jgi:hypothetical protein
MLPLQTPFAPSPNEAFDQEQEENQYRDERTDRQTSKGYGEWHQKDRFHIKYEEYDRVQIVLGTELDLRFTKRFDAALVDRVLLRAWFRRLKNSPPQPGQGERDQWKNERHANENDDEQVGIRPHLFAIKFARKAKLPSLYSVRGKDGKEISQFRRG